MRLSCNGCRVLRKGCSDDCTIRPCLQWIKSPEAQANATVFLAKFYGRAGLLNLVNAGPDHLRPAVFRSLLYEACGRIVNPIYGSVGLLWSGSWQLCQAAVEDVLRGVPIVPIASEPTAKASAPMPTPKFYDIRHIPKEHGATTELHKITRTRTQFKRSATTKPTSSPSLLANDPAIDFLCALSKHAASYAGGDNAEEESMFSLDTVEASHVSQTKPDKREYRAQEAELELTLGFPPETYSTSGRERVASPATYEISEISGPGADASNVELALEPLG